MDSTAFNSKRFSHYFDELNRLHPIVEETIATTATTKPSKFYSNVETKNFQSAQRTENGKIVYEYTDSSLEKTSNVNNSVDDKNGRTTLIGSSDLPNKSAFNIDNTIDRQSESARYRKYEECKNSKCSQNETIQKLSEKPSDESFSKCSTTNQVDKHEPPNRFSFKEFDFVPKIITNFFRSNKSGIDTSSEVKEETHQQTEQFITKNDNILTSSPIPLRKGEEHHLSTQSLYDWFSGGDNPERPSSRNNLTVGSAPGRGRISPNPIRAPRINDPIPPPRSGERHYDWNCTKNVRNFENRQSMIDQTPITRPSMMDLRRRSLPKAIADKQLANIMEKEKHLNNEFDKLERDRQRLIKELEEMQVNQSFEDFYKAHKRRNSLQPNVNHLSEAELLRMQMQDEWLSKVAEREERRLQKIIKVTHSSSEIASPPSKSLTNRGLCDEFLDRVKERRSKLQMPSDSDWESGAESQPIPRNDDIDAEPSPKIDPTVKVVDDGGVADLQKLPQHLKEFAEFTTKIEQTNQSGPFDMADKPKEIIHKIKRCDNEDGESVVVVKFTIFCLVIALIVYFAIFNKYIENS